MTVETLVRITRLGCGDPEAAEALHDGLEALQKLSEGRSAQKLMIRHGVSGTAELPNSGTAEQRNREKAELLNVALLISVPNRGRMRMRLARTG